MTVTGNAFATETGPRDPADLALYPFVHPVTARFADVDSLGHLNNVAIASFYEDARVAHLRELTGGDAMAAVSRGGAFHVLLAEMTIRYLAEASYPGSFRVGMGVARLGTSSVIHHSALFGPDGCAGTCRSVLVHIVDDAPAPLSPGLRSALESLAFPR
jgi:acyl-CoA thioester hydrolase